MRVLTLSLLLMLLHLVLPSAATFAHRPLFPGEGEGTATTPYTIPDVVTSWAIYNRTGPDGTSVYEVQGKAGQQLAMELLIPVHHWQEATWPQVSIYAPGGTRLAGPSSREGDRKRFYEPFTQTAYFRVHSVDLTLPEPGTYRIEIRSDRPGVRHVLAPGRQERWRPTDLLRFPLIWFRVRYWVSPAAALGGVGALLLPFVIVAAVRRRRAS